MTELAKENRKVNAEIIEIECNNFKFIQEGKYSNRARLLIDGKEMEGVYSLLIKAQVGNITKIILGVYPELFQIKEKND